MACEERVRELLDIFEAPGACAAELLCDRHPAEAVAFTIVQADLSHKDLTYGELREKSTAFAAALHGLGVRPGDAVATLMGKSEDLIIALLGIWRRGAVDVPLFTAFAADAIAFRLNATGSKLVICDVDQRRKLVPAGEVPSDATPLVVVAHGEALGYDLSFSGLLSGNRAAGDTDSPEAVAVGGNGTLVQLFTSGTTGEPKGVPIPLRSVASFIAYQEFALDVQPDDVFWNAADPGWAYGLYFAILAPLATGTRSILLQGGFSAERTWQIFDRFKVTNFAAAPTVYRSLRAGSAAGAGHRLRRASSAGEPLTPDVITWSKEALGLAVRDQYGQTEHGMVVGNAWREELQAPLREGSMGTSLPGWSADILDPLEDIVAPAGTAGRVAIEVAKSPLMWFTGYAGAAEKTADRYTADGRWYLTGDAGRKDEDGFIYFSARDDDVIIMAGYRIGPFDVESVLAQHPDVVECAAVGAPDEIRGEVLEAYVVLREGVGGSGELAEELQRLVKTKLAAHAYPRRIHFVDHLPKTPSGKVQRFILRRERAAEAAAGTAAGDIAK
ncbi:AMP-binding protein [Arthrobacter sp. A5]|uniref:AMP-binding protein n=1 Tax=Arthrobacter sp. A5 TaxID=576926 RepID=UPI003DA8A42D